MQDKQSERDMRGIRINKVGVKGVRYPIVVRDLARKTQNTVARISMYVDLPHHFKGTHMSRFIEVLNEYGQVVHVENIPHILRRMRERLNAEYAHLQIEFPYFIEKKAPVSQAAGTLDYEVAFLASTEKEGVDFTLVVAVPVTTVCPCSKGVSERGAHNQRSMVTVHVRSHKTIWIEEVIQLVEVAASCELYALLKREDEKFVTERAYDRPVFVEDLVRTVAVGLQKDSRVVWYRIEAENLESIHNHSAYAMVENAVNRGKA